MTYGITRYQWSKNKAQPLILVPIGSDLYLYDKRILRLLAQGSHQTPILDPKLSPDGTLVAYVQDSELYCISTALSIPPAEPRRLTFDARHYSHKTNGLAEFIAQEEMDRNDGFWWSDNSRFIAFTQVDESNVPAFRISHSGSDDPEEVISIAQTVPILSHFPRLKNIGIHLPAKRMCRSPLALSI